jgi:hypothetical protein
MFAVMVVDVSSKGWSESSQFMFKILLKVTMKITIFCDVAACISYISNSGRTLLCVCVCLHSRRYGLQYFFFFFFFLRCYNFEEVLACCNTSAVILLCRNSLFIIIVILCNCVSKMCLSNYRTTHIQNKIIIN